MYTTNCMCNTRAAIGLERSVIILLLAQLGGSQRPYFSRENKCQLMATSLLLEVTDPAVFVQKLLSNLACFYARLLSEYS